MLSDLPRPIIFAHRGASAYAPENTLAAFELALRQGADAIELDAKFSADGHVVVIHDPTVDRTTMHHGLVRDFPLSELRKMDAGSHFDVAFRGEPIPTLDEVFRAVGQLTYINVELTNYTTLFDDLPAKVAALVKRHKIQRRVLFSSFNPLAILHIRRLMPESPIGLLCLHGRKGAWARSALGRLLRYNTLHVHFEDVTLGLVDKTHRSGRQVFAYTVNQEDQMRCLLDMGVDGLFTDDPILALQIIQRNKSRRYVSL